MRQDIGYMFENRCRLRYGWACPRHTDSNQHGWRRFPVAGIILLAVFLGGCGQGTDMGNARGGSPSGQMAGTASEEDMVSGTENKEGQAQADEGHAKAGEGQPEADGADSLEPMHVSGVQFVEGHGICAPGKPPVYYAEPGQQPISTQGAKAWLESVTYQDGKWYYRVKVEDYSVTVIPDDEVKVLLKEEEENRKLQEEGRPVKWKKPYFVLDYEGGVYGRSGFLDRTGLGHGFYDRTKESMTDYIEGAGIPGGRITATKRTGSIVYGTYGTEGYITMYWDYFTENQVLDTLTPEGTYELHVPGFEQTLSFAFVKAREYPAVEDIPGIVFQEGMGILAKGQWADDGLDITYYTYPEQGYIMYPVISGLSYENGDMEGKGRLRDSGHSANDSWDYISGIPEGKQGQTVSYDLAPSARGGRIWLGFDSVNMIYTGEPERLSVPIRDGGSDMDAVIELGGCTVKFTSARKSEEPVLGNVWGADEEGPFVFVGAEVRMKDSSRKFIRLNMHRAVENPASYPDSVMARPVYEGAGTDGGNMGSSGLKGYEVSCSEGESVVELEISGVMYDWKQEYLVPVQIEEP